jgi:hypothetical protein
MVASSPGGLVSLERFATIEGVLPSTLRATTPPLGRYDAPAEAQSDNVAATQEFFIFAQEIIAALGSQVMKNEDRATLDGIE